ncbi:MAG: CapA family protein [Candidatus Sabulitectum sp.]|nr:CapA family protein [Candidatus Sabulitectum sp.]
MKSSILFTGDLGLTSGCKRIPEVFSPSLLERFESADAVCVNLELPFVDEDCRMAPYTHPSLISSPEHASLLKALKPAVVNTGTNHCMDGGRAGIELTESILAAMGVCSIGSGVNEDGARKPCFLQIDGVTFGFLSFCKKGNFTSSGDKAGAALLSEANLRADIPVAAEKCDFLIVLMHMGMEFSKSVHPMYRELAHLAVDLGASCVIGHHPHVIQGIETYKNAPIFYSLGNFLFDNYAGAVTYKAHWEARHRGILAKVFFSSAGVSYEAIPVIYTSKPLAVRIAEGTDGQDILSEINFLSESISEGIDESSAETEAVGAIAKREIATIIVLTRIHGLRFLWYFVKDLKLRHFRMVFRAIWKRITCK